MTPRTSPRSRRDRPAKPALTHDAIVAAAVRLMAAEGLQRVTMRRLAQELDTGPASLYVYVAGTAELHAAILEDLLGEVDLASAAGDGDWRDRLAQVLLSYTRVLFDHPGLAHSALVARPSGPHYLALVETILALLHQGGVPDGQAAWGWTSSFRWPPPRPPSSPRARAIPTRRRTTTRSSRRWGRRPPGPTRASRRSAPT